jgi:hypothetical protein
MDLPGADFEIEIVLAIMRFGRLLRTFCSGMRRGGGREEERKQSYDQNCRYDRFLHIFHFLLQSKDPNECLLLQA